MANQFVIREINQDKYYWGSKQPTATGSGGWAGMDWVSSNTTAGSNVDAATLAAHGHKVPIDGVVREEKGDEIEVCIAMATDPTKGVDSELTVRWFLNVYQCYTRTGLTSHVGQGTVDLSFSTKIDDTIGACGNVSVTPTSWAGDCDLYFTLVALPGTPVNVSTLYVTYSAAYVSNAE